MQHEAGEGQEMQFRRGGGEPLVGADLTKDDVARVFTRHYLNSLRNRAQQS